MSNGRPTRRAPFTVNFAAAATAHFFWGKVGTNGRTDADSAADGWTQTQPQAKQDSGNYDGDRRADERTVKESVTCTVY